jgi:integrase
MRRWGLYKDRGRWVIRRGKERLPAHKYRNSCHNEEELSAFVKRLNAPVDAQAKVQFKHAFIDDALMAEYLEWLLVKIPTERNALCEFGYLKKYFLNFFIGRLDLMNPADWYAYSETKWASLLLSKEAPKAAKTKRAVIQAANRFMGWLRKKRPGEIPELELEPLSKARFKKLEEERRIQGWVKVRLFIDERDWQRIRNNAGGIYPHVMLAACYGLRRSEVLGLKPVDVEERCLKAERQLRDLAPTYGPLKGRGARKIEHWYCQPSEALEWIESMSLMHPDTLTDRWNELMKALDLPYDFHDLRHTYVTLAIRDHAPVDVMHAAGHKNIETTMRYLHDDRGLDSKKSA